MGRTVVAEECEIEAAAIRGIATRCRQRGLYRPAHSIPLVIVDATLPLALKPKIHNARVRMCHYCYFLRGGLGGIADKHVPLIPPI